MMNPAWWARPPLYSGPRRASSASEARPTPGAPRQQVPCTPPPVSSSGVGPWKALSDYPTTIALSSCVVFEAQYTSPPPLRQTSTVPYITCVGGDSEQSSNGPVSTVYVWSGGTGAWTASTSYPVPVMRHSCVFNSGYIYCVAGFETTNGNLYYWSGVYYAPVSSSGVGAWSATTSYAINTSDLSCVPSSGYMYCMGGTSVYYSSLSSSGAGSWTEGAGFQNSIYGYSDTYCATYSGPSTGPLGYNYCVGNGSGLATNGVFYSAIIPPESTTTVVSTTTVPGPTITTTSTVNSTSTTTATSTTTTTSTTTVTAGANQTATVTSTSISPTTITQTLTATDTEDSTLTATATATATTTATSTITDISTETLTNPSTSTATVTTTVPQTVSATTGTTPNETVTSTVQKTVTATSEGSPDLTPYLIVGVAIVLAGGLLGAAMLRLRRPK